MVSVSRKSPLDKFLDGLERKAKKAVRKQTRKVKRAAVKQVRKTGRKAGKAVAKSARAAARAAVERARVKPDRMLRDMRDAGWTGAQIQQRTGIPKSTQTKILSGKSTGAKWLDSLREARKTGRKPPPEHIERIQPVRSALAEGAGRVRRTKRGTVIEVIVGKTSREWVQQQQAAARGMVSIRYVEPRQSTAAAGDAAPEPDAVPEPPEPESAGDDDGWSDIELTEVDAADIEDEWARDEAAADAVADAMADSETRTGSAVMAVKFG